jgi:uncharacterized SAM-binding protein YcdF (DUF218 family)
VPRAARLLIFLAILAAACWWGFVSLGHILHHEDHLEKADVIFALGGSRVDRIAEAGDLHLEGWAPRIMLSGQISEGAEDALRKRGITIPSELEMQRTILVSMGVPPDAIEELPDEQLTTATEGAAIASLARARNWSRIIVVTSKLHTTRARLAIRRSLQGTNAQVVVRATRYDPADVDRWWANRSDLRFALFEAQRLAAYWVGLAD